MGDSESASRNRIGQYAIADEIARGGMASVHLGRRIGPVGFSRIVAIKRLHPPFADDPEFVSMFVDEARIAARIHHPNVVSIVDVLGEGRELSLVMDYVHGEALSRLLRAHEHSGVPIPRPIVIGLMRDLLDGLHAAHEAKDGAGQPLGIVHRDISPGNVLVGADGVARVVDFGIAKARGRSAATRHGEVKGKLAYMAPEQLLQGFVDRRADLYAAGLVMWELLVGRRVFAKRSEQEILDMKLHGRISPLLEAAPDVLPDLASVVDRATAREASDRFPSARQMALALDECGPSARRHETGAWVQATVGDELEARALLIASLEARPTFREAAPHDAAHDAAHDPVAAPERAAPPPWKLGTRSLAVVSCALVAAALAFARVHSARVPRAAAATASLSHDPGDPPPTTPPLALPSVAPATPTSISTSITSGVTPVQAPATNGPVPARAPRSHLPNHSVPATACDPPYSLDRDGIKHYKIECQQP